MTKKLNNSSIEDRIKKIIKKQFNIKKKIISNISFINDLKADSLDMIELIMSLEEEFNINILDHEIDKLTNLKKVIDFIEKKKIKK